MFPQYHFLFGLISSGFLYFIFPDIGELNLAIFILASILIDVDHYLYYVYKKKDLSLFNAIRWGVEKSNAMHNLKPKIRAKFYSGIFFLHGVEALILLISLGYFVSYLFYFVCIGVAFHLFLDQIYQTWRKDRVQRLSVIYDYYKSGKLKFVEEIK